MNFIRERALSGELLAGAFLNLGSSLTVEMAGRAGLDFVLIDMERGGGDQESLVPQLQEHAVHLEDLAFGLDTSRAEAAKLDAQIVEGEKKIAGYEFIESKRGRKFTTIF